MITFNIPWIEFTIFYLLRVLVFYFIFICIPFILQVKSLLLVLYLCSFICIFARHGFGSQFQNVLLFNDWLTLTGHLRIFNIIWNAGMVHFVHSSRFQNGFTHSRNLYFALNVFLLLGHRSPRTHVAKLYDDFRWFCQCFRASQFSVFEIRILLLLFCGFNTPFVPSFLVSSLFSVLGFTLHLHYFGQVLRILKPETRVWSILFYFKRVYPLMKRCVFFITLLGEYM